MRLKDVIRAPKTIVDAGTWKTGDKMPKTAFPLGKTHFKVGGNWHWRIVKFTCLGKSFRLLIQYRVDLQKCTIHLGKESPTDLVLQARYEWAPNDKGWHLHCCQGCDDVHQAVGTTGLHRRLPAPDDHHRRAEFGVHNGESAFRVASEAFNLFGRGLSIPAAATQQ